MIFEDASFPVENLLRLESMYMYVAQTFKQR